MKVEETVRLNEVNFTNPMVRNRAILVVWLVGRWPMVHDTSLRWVRESGGAIGRIGRSVVVGMMVLLR